MNLKEYCDRERITLKSIADSLGISYTYLNNCIKGQRRMSIDMARVISSHCDNEVTVDDLMPYERHWTCVDPTCHKLIPRKWWPVRKAMTKEDNELLDRLSAQIREVFNKYTSAKKGKG